MSFLSQLGLSGIEFSLILAVLTVFVLLLVVVLRGQKSDPATTTHMSGLADALGRLASDQAELRGQIKLMTEGQETGRRQVAEQLQKQEREINKALTERLDTVSQRVGETLQKTNERTATSLTDLQKRLAVIDAAQKNITDLSTDIVGLQDILSNKQARGAFGQAQMEDIVRDMLPADYFKFEATLSNNKRVDCLITLPGNQGDIGVDSKYPHEGFVRLMESQSDEERKTASQAFTRDVIKHIRDISSKYIIPGETSDWALMFVPAESIYMELHTNYQNVIQEGYRRKIVIASPSSFWAILHSVRALIRDTKMRENAGQIQKQVELLMQDAGRLSERVNSLDRNFKASSKNIEDIKISSRKIALHGDKIRKVDLQNDLEEQSESLLDETVDSLADVEELNT